METTLVLVRHAATAANLARPSVLQGSSRDNDLDELGVRQASAVAEALALMPLAAVYSSPLKRAARTATAIAERHGSEVQTVDALAEVDVGVWEGCSWEQIVRRWPVEHDAFLSRPSRNGYLGGECFDQVRDRCLPACEALIRRHPDRVVAVIAHNVVNRTLLAHWMAVPLDFTRRIPQVNAGYNIVVFRDGVAKVRTINAAAHLSGLLPPE